MNRILWLILCCFFLANCSSIPAGFSGKRAHELIEQQLSFGDRTPASEGHEKVIDWIQAKLAEFGWDIEVQQGSSSGKTLVNIIGKGGNKPRFILGAHYDTRQVANKDPDLEKRLLPVPGAIDGASGVAVLLELANSLPERVRQDIWLVFFDLEDQGNISDWNWIMGSQYFVDHLEEKPEAVIIVDMVGDEDLKIYLESNSSPSLANQVWETAKILNYQDYFLPEVKYSLIDDHLPFLSAGIPAILIIDFDYPYWHTTQDTLDKVSEKSLQIIGDVLYSWLTTP